MSDENFTPGEWGICHFDNEPYFPERFMVHEPNYGEVAIVNFHVKSDGITEKANAHLIAAAPEMYKKLEKIQHLFYTIAYRQICASDDDKKAEPWMKMSMEIHKLLKKARGEDEQ